MSDMIKIMNKELVKKEEVSFEGWKVMRKSFMDNIQTIMVKGKDYHDLNFRGKDVRVLAKGGAEKVASAFGWVASFKKDTETVDMLKLEKGVAYVCTLTDKKGKVIGEGRGARMLAKDDNDPNKTIKMAQKSAFIDAVLRTSGLSDLFTQDLEDVKEEPQGAEIVERIIDAEPTEEVQKPPIESDAKLRKNQIARLLKVILGTLPKSKKEADQAILKYTGLDMRAENYDAIIERLTNYDVQRGKSAN